MSSIEEDTVISLPPADTEVLGRGHRPHVPSVRLKDAEALTPVTHHALINSTTKSESSSSVQGISLYPLTKFISDTDFSPQHQVFLAAITAGTEPKHFKDAVGIKVWDDAMVVEVVALEDADT